MRILPCINSKDSWVPNLITRLQEALALSLPHDATPIAIQDYVNAMNEPAVPLLAALENDDNASAARELLRQLVARLHDDASPQLGESPQVDTFFQSYVPTADIQAIFSEVTLTPIDLHSIVSDRLTKMFKTIVSVAETLSDSCSTSYSSFTSSIISRTFSNRYTSNYY
jgi:hypothetical protein